MMRKESLIECILLAIIVIIAIITLGGCTTTTPIVKYIDTSCIDNMKLLDKYKDKLINDRNLLDIRNLLVKYNCDLPSDISYDIKSYEEDFHIKTINENRELLNALGYNVIFTHVFTKYSEDKVIIKLSMGATLNDYTKSIDK